MAAIAEVYGTETDDMIGTEGYRSIVGAMAETVERLAAGIGGAAAVHIHDDDETDNRPAVLMLRDKGNGWVPEHDAPTPSGTPAAYRWQILATPEHDVWARALSPVGADAVAAMECFYGVQGD